MDMKSDNSGQCGVPSQRRGPANRRRDPQDRFEAISWARSWGRECSSTTLLHSRL